MYGLFRKLRSFLSLGLRVLFAALLLLVFVAWTLSHYYTFGVGYTEGYKGDADWVEGRKEDTTWAIRVSEQEVSLWKIRRYSVETGFESFGCRNGRQKLERIQILKGDEDMLYHTSDYDTDGEKRGERKFGWFDFSFTREAGGHLPVSTWTIPFFCMIVPLWFLTCFAAFCLWAIWRLTSVHRSQPVSWRKATAPLWVIRWVLVSACLMTLSVWCLSHWYQVAIGYVGTPTWGISINPCGVQCGKTNEKVVGKGLAIEVSFIHYYYSDFKRAGGLWDGLEYDESRSFWGIQLEHDAFGTFLLVPYWFFVASTATACWWSFRRTSLRDDNKQYGFPVTITPREDSPI
ncbi:MAG: hypothetical protein FWD61_13370 [Phycisphaerales bacterium]|nr:hypothetical protein [Phycisphaerales bacterium]